VATTGKLHGLAELAPPFLNCFPIKQGTRELPREFLLH